MLRGLVFFITNVLVILILSSVLSGFQVASIWAAVTLVVVLTLLNWTLGFVLKLFTFPLNFLSFGLFGLIINLFVLWVSLNIPQGITVTGSSLDRIILLIIISVSLSIGQGIVHGFLPLNHNPRNEI